MNRPLVDVQTHFHPIIGLLLLGKAWQSMNFVTDGSNVLPPNRFVIAGVGMAKAYVPGSADVFYFGGALGIETVDEVSIIHVNPQMSIKLNWTKRNFNFTKYTVIS